MYVRRLINLPVNIGPMRFTIYPKVYYTLDLIFILRKRLRGQVG
ncbi:unnamed protein product [Debaryomyces tyrocola]|nr:unnamed protein product [Debaryomyces tyrocola]